MNLMTSQRMVVVCLASLLLFSRATGQERFPSLFDVCVENQILMSEAVDMNGDGTINLVLLGPDGESRGSRNRWQ